MKRREFLQTIFGLGIGMGLQPLLPAMAAAAGRPAFRPNILWIMMDDGRADAVGAYGQPWVRTPAMDAIAGDGVLFQTAIIQNPVCVPSRSSMLSARYPYELEMMAMGKPPEREPQYYQHPKPQVTNLLEVWRAAGVDPQNVGKEHGFDKDFTSLGDVPPHFDVYGKPRDDATRKQLEIAHSTYPEVVTKTHRWAIGGIIPLQPEATSTWQLGDRAVETLDRLGQQDGPFFLRVSFHAPHVPCRVPESYFVDPDTIRLPLPTQEELDSKPQFEKEGLRVYAGGLDLSREQIDIARGTYYGMVSLVDAQVGRMVEVLKKHGVYDNTIIAINSDQGFQLGEHGLWKKRVFYEQNVKIPFILSYPAGLPQGKEISEPVEMMDFMPTLLDLSGLEVPGNVRGRSLLPLINGEVSVWRPACFSEIDHSQSMYDELRHGTGRRVMVRTREWKLIAFMDARVEEKDGALYHLQTDPGETKNLFGDPKYAGVVARLEDLARQWDRRVD